MFSKLFYKEAITEENDRVRTDGESREEIPTDFKHIAQLRVLLDVEQTDHAFLDIKSEHQLLYENYAVTTTCAVDVGFSESELKIYPHKEIYITPRSNPKAQNVEDMTLRSSEISFAQMIESRSISKL